MEHPSESPGSSLNTRTESPRAFEGTTTSKISQFPVKNHLGPIKYTNAHARIGINSIPPELLSKIFLVCAALWPTRDRDKYSSPGDFTCGDHLPWIAIAQVCQYWRSVALGCGELWGGLLFSSPEATKEMLRRSKGVTLILKAWGGYDPVIHENVRMVVPDIWRVSVLHLCFPEQHLQPLLHDISLASPNLKSLRLCSGRIYNPDIDLNNFAQPSHIPDAILARIAPSLRVLELTHCRISWKSLLLIFRGVPMLDTLILNHALPKNILNETGSDITSPMKFPPHLHILTLGSSVGACTNLFAQFTHPIAAIVTFRCRFPMYLSKLQNFLQRAHSAVRYGSGDHIIQSLGIGTIDHPWRLILRCLVAPCSSAPIVPSPLLPQLNVVFAWESYGRIPVAELIHAAIVTLPLAEVQNLYLLGQWWADWSEILQHLPKIHTIHFREALPSELIKVLAEGGDKTMGSAEPVAMFLPHLRSLWFSGVNFNIWGELKESLVACFQSRLQAGFAIHDLHLKNCWNLFARDVEDMRVTVHRVDWDGVEQDEEDADDSPKSSGHFQWIYD